MTEDNGPAGNDVQWQSSRDAALAQLQGFLPRAGRHYKRGRNTDPGPGHRDGVSQLSPWLRHRMLLESEVVGATLTQHGFGAAEKFLQEVCWRTYWKGWLERRPAVWRQYRQEVLDRLDELSASDPLRPRYERAVTGRTGIECMDAWSQELTRTGYLHNHARMWFASIWIFTLNLPWALGADFFLRHLLDGDPASNTLSWRWVAGLQTPGKTYLARADNIRRHTDGRFSPAPTELAAHAEPVSGPDLPDDQPPPASHSVPREAAILLHEDDLAGPHDATDLPLGHGLAVLQATDHRSPGDVGEAVKAFAGGACADALDRAASTFQRSGATRILASQGVGELLGWARETGMSAIVTPWAPCGPVAEHLDAAEPALRAEGIQLYRVQRAWDQECWQHATRGFFGFWKPVSRKLRDGRLPMSSPFSGTTTAGPV